jgi:hypothetical protein
MFSTGEAWRWTSQKASCFSDSTYGRDRVPTKRLSMRKLNEVLRLRFELGLGQRAIARSCSISQGAVHNYLKKAAAAGIPWPLPEGWDEKRIEEALFGDRRPVEQRPRVLPDFPGLREQLQRHPHLTLQLAWEEYRQVHSEGFDIDPGMPGPAGRATRYEPVVASPGEHRLPHRAHCS